MLLVDASNALLNMSTICPPFSTVLMNIYRESSDLILGNSILQSQEGTTQGPDPLAMPFYALATRPLIDTLDPDLRQIWYADDATAVGKLVAFHQHKQDLAHHRKQCSHSHLHVRRVNITTEGRPVLGSPIGKPEFIANFVNEKAKVWCEEIVRICR